jgi:hypothetical protein
MPRVGFEHTTTVFETAKAVYASDGAGHCDRFSEISITAQLLVEFNS